MDQWKFNTQNFAYWNNSKTLKYIRFLPAVTVGAMYVCGLYAILFLKLWSYVQVNMWCRLSSRSKNTSQGRMRRQSLSYTDLHCKYIRRTIPARKIDVFCCSLSIYLSVPVKRLIPRYVNQSSLRVAFFSKNILTLLKCERWYRVADDASDVIFSRKFIRELWRLMRQRIWWCKMYEFQYSNNRCISI